MAADKSAPENQVPNARPRKVTSLLHDSGEHLAWTHANRRQNRFYVVNLPLVLGKIPVQITKYEADFKAAEKAIAEGTTWRTDHPFDYLCSPTQIYDRAREPKTFDRAATIIVAMEIAARRTNAPVNVYDFLRIMAADCFVDKFDTKRLTELEAAHEAMTSDERMTAFGPAFANKKFEEICLAMIEQSKEGLVRKLTEGYCATHYTCEKLMSFVNTHCPDLRVGPILQSGQHSISSGLGERAAAEGLRVPATIEQEQLAPCN
jgi:hypothetical protein